MSKLFPVNPEQRPSTQLETNEQLAAKDAGHIRWHSLNVTWPCSGEMSRRFTAER